MIYPPQISYGLLSLVTDVGSKHQLVGKYSNWLQVDFLHTVPQFRAEVVNE